MSEPLSEEELAAIRKSIEFQARVAQARDDNSDALLAEVERLRAENAAMRGTLADVLLRLEDVLDDEDLHREADTRLLAKARALLAKEGGA